MNRVGHIMRELKKPTTYKEQLEKIKSRGCAVTCDVECIEQLRRIGYYRLTGYFLPFKEGERYRDRTSFTQVLSAYEFDRKMHSILSLAIEEIEVQLRSTLSYFHAHKYGEEGYINLANFSGVHAYTKFISTFLRATSKDSSLIVEHHKNHYRNRLPIWAAFELLSFSALSRFYCSLKVADKKAIAKQFDKNYHYKDVESWITCCVDLRNACAHYSRLYYHYFPREARNIPAPTLSEDDYAKRRLFAHICALQNLYPNTEAWQNEVVNPIAALIDQYGEHINLLHIGFPSDWERILRS